MSTELATAQRLAQSLANTIKAPTYVVEQGGKYLIQDDQDLSVYFASIDPAQIVATYQPIAVAPPGFPEDDDDSPDGGGPPRAVTLTSIAIDQALERNRLCKNPDCQGPHHTWQCPAIRARLFAAEVWSDPDLGRELCRMMWRRYPAFVTLLREVHGAGHLETYARSYQVFIRANRPDSDLTIPQVLDAWSRVISGEREPMIREAA